ncbi:MAG: UDP-glucose 4-epimerase GalE [Puniceicoccales bacterium]|nr:UDP-glucose 4-epimerase GalE [Puniceicoccales bacterium]
MNILIIGGAGYVGSHCTRQVIKAGHRPVVLDNLVLGHRQAVPPQVPFYHSDLADQATVRHVLRHEKIDIVMHFAAFTNVGESVSNPVLYYKNNVAKTLALLETMMEENVLKFIFSSTAAVYGIPQTIPITEAAPTAPINPYGQTKLDCENLIASLAHAHGLSSAIFRYFNACGAAENGSIGEAHTPETHLIPNAIRANLGIAPPVNIYGTDYPTPDGTCLRDYVHVDDLARAHIAAFDKLDRPGTLLRFNLGNGRPNSIYEIIQTIEKISGKKTPVIVSARRPGDPPELCADATAARTQLNWRPCYDNIEIIIKTAWTWHISHPNGFC